MHLIPFLLFTDVGILCRKRAEWGVIHCQWNPVDVFVVVSTLHLFFFSGENV
jgi:hypothetical protein